MSIYGLHPPEPCGLGQGVMARVRIDLRESTSLHEVLSQYENHAF